MTRTTDLHQPLVPTARTRRGAPGRGRRGVVVLTALLAVGALGGCSVTSPSTAVEPYQAADGLSATLSVRGSELRLQNFVVVSTAKGGPGTVVGAIGYDGTEPLEVRVGDVAGPGTPVTVKPGVLTQVGPAGTPVQLASVDAAPGAHVKLQAVVRGSVVEILAPVLTPTGYYASLSPTPVPTASPEAASESASPTASPTATP